MDTLIDYLDVLVRVGMGIGLIVFAAIRAKRVGGGAWLVASLGAVNVLLVVMFRVMSHMHDVFEHAIVATRMIDAGFTTITALLVFVGCILLRS